MESKCKKKKIDYYRNSHKEIIRNKIFANNYRKEKTVSEEIKLRKKKKKLFMIY